MLSQSQIAKAWGPPCSGKLATVSLHGAGKVTVRSSIVEATKAFNSCLVTWNYKTIYAQTGAMACRLKVTGTGWSNHSYGVAIDINWLLNPYGGNKYHIPANLAAAICRIRTNNGKQVWNWGGYWRGTKDWMHFDIVCTPGDLATGINWSTVNGKPTGSVPQPPKEEPKEEEKEPEKEEDEEMEWLRLHHNGSWWLYRGSFRTPVTDADQLARWNAWLAPQGRVVDLRKDQQLSQMFFDSSIDATNINKSFMYSVQNSEFLKKIMTKLGIK